MLNTLDRPRIESQVLDQKYLGEAITLPASGLTSPTRFLKAAMSERLSSWNQSRPENRGIPSPQLINLYREWGKGGFGIIITGNAMVNPVDLEAPANLVVYRAFETPERVEAYHSLADAMKAQGSLAFLQLSHGGRQTPKFINGQPISASDVQLADSLGMSFGKPRGMTIAEIDDVVDQFAYGAEFAYKTGFHVVQLHGGHGYLLAQFLSETTNKRSDEYGGSLSNRARLTYRIVEEIKRRVPDPKFSIGIKINSAEFQEGGFQPKECREVCCHLENLGLDWIELSGGTYEQLAFMGNTRESTKLREAFFLEFAEVIRPALRVPVFVTGGFQTGAAMVKAVQIGSTDGIGLARAICEEPYLPNYLIHGTAHAKVDTKLNYSEFPTWSALAGAQMRRVAFGMDTADSTSVQVLQQFLVELESFVSFRGTEMSKGLVHSGHPSFGTPSLPWEANEIMNE